MWVELQGARIACKILFLVRVIFSRLWALIL